MDADHDEVFKALADRSRRLLLDRLREENGQTLSQLCQRMEMTRQAVTKHLKVLEEASLVVPIWHGREKLHYLNPVPIHQIAGAGSTSSSRGGFAPWPTSRRNWKERPMAESRFVYVTFIRTTPERLWHALLGPGVYPAILGRDLARLRLEARCIVADHDPRRSGCRQR